METLTDPAATPVEQPTQVETPAPVVESPAAPFPTPEPASEAAPEDTEPEPTPEPVRGRITLVTGREHEVVDIAEITDALGPSTSASEWLVFQRPNGTPLTVRGSAIVSYE